MYCPIIGQRQIRARPHHSHGACLQNFNPKSGSVSGHTRVGKGTKKACIRQSQPSKDKRPCKQSFISVQGEVSDGCYSTASENSWHSLTWLKGKKRERIWCSERTYFPQQKSRTDTHHDTVVRSVM